MGSVQAGGTFASEVGSLWGSLGKIFLYLTATNSDGTKERCTHFSVPHAPHLAAVQPLGGGQLFCDPWTVALQAPWGSPSRNTGVGCHFLLQEIFPGEGSNPCLPAGGFFTTEPGGKATHGI